MFLHNGLPGSRCSGFARRDSPTPGMEPPLHDRSTQEGPPTGGPSQSEQEAVGFRIALP